VLDAADVQGERDMSGFGFEVTADGESIGRLTTGIDGRTPTIDTTGGTYTITEVARPSWADGLIDGGPITFEFEPGDESILVTYTNVVPDASITTAARDASDGDQVVDLAFGDATIIDTVSYTALVPGTEYIVAGELMVRTTTDAASDDAASDGAASGTDAAQSGAAQSGDGSAVTVPEMIGTGIVASTTFVPDGPDGSVDVVFTVPGDSPLLGHVVVVYQRLSVAASGRIVANHADPDAVEQTIHFAEPIPTTVATTAPTTAPPTVAAPVPSPETTTTPTTTTTTPPGTTTTTPTATTTPPTTSPPPAERSLPRTGGDGSRPMAAAGLAMLLLGLGLLLATVRAPALRRSGVRARPDM